MIQGSVPHRTAISRMVVPSLKRWTIPSRSFSHRSQSVFLRPISLSKVLDLGNQDLDDLAAALLERLVHAVRPEPFPHSLLRGAGLEIDGGDDEATLRRPQPLPAVRLDLIFLHGSLCQKDDTALRRTIGSMV